MSEPRRCDHCGSMMSPRWPRKRQPTGEMWCPACQNRAQHVLTTQGAIERHPDIDWQVRTFGAANVSLGRAGYAHHRTGATYAEQEDRLADAGGWDHSKTGFQPVRFAIEGARDYAHKIGLADPHATDYAHIHVTPDLVRSRGRAYDALPEHDPAAEKHFHAMGKEVGDQYHHLTHTMGIKVHSVDHDPYANVHELVKDVRDNKRLNVLGTHVTGGHPFFSNEENDKFRAVHDFFGHAATGRDFSRHGEEAAYRAHAAMFSEHARPALASETRGQNSSLILNGHFGPQRVAVMGQQHLAAGWSGEDVIRHELGRQKVHQVHVNGQPAGQMCPQHLQMARQRSDFATGLARQVGQPGRYPTIQVSPLTEGKCGECARVSGTQSLEHPWERREQPGAIPAKEEQVPNSYSLLHREPRPYVDRIEPVRPQIQSLNRRVALAHRMGEPGKMNGPGPIRVQNAPAKTLGGEGSGIHTGSMKKHSHDSGDGETVFHCPFCGSGQVIARSDGTIECEFCFAGETEFITWDGIRTFKETVGTVQRVLVSQKFTTQVAKGKSRLGNPKLADEQVVEIRDLYATGQITKAELARQFDVVQGCIKKIIDRTSHQHLGGGGHGPGECPAQQAVYGQGHSEFGGIWVDAEIRSFGVQPLMKVTLVRNGVEKVIHATAEHRWYVNPRNREGFTHSHKTVVQTKDLPAAAGRFPARLAPLFPRTRLRLNSDTRPSPFGIAHGFTFGDGNLTGRGGAQVTMWGEKDRSLLPYFAASHMINTKNANGTPGVVVKDLPAFFKEFPPQSESLSYLYGWLAGYFAADGSVGKTGAAQLSSAKRECLEHVRTLCSRIGIGTYDISEAVRSGFGEDPTPLYSLTFVASTLTADFFVIPAHRARFLARTGARDQTGWSVVSVEETDRVEEVFCAVVPGHENFTLAGNINVMNCTTAFTVQVQPVMSAFPQTIDGVPVDVPGMPAGGQNANVPPGAAPGAPGAADGDPEAADEGADDGDDDSGGDDKPAFLKGSVLRTQSGAELPTEHYMQHLALAHATDRHAVLAKIREENGSR